jgi:Spy/CpxP family protein refolding chaperone
MGRVRASMLIVVTAAVAAACGGSKGVGPATPTAPGATPAPAERGEHPARRFGGMVALVRASLAELALRADQRAATDAVANELEKAGEGTRDAAKRLIEDVAAGVAAGQLDRAKIGPDVEQVASSAAATQPSVEDAMQRLHDTLDPAQRKQLVEAMRRAREEAREERGERGHERMQKLVEGLALSPEQRESIRDRVRTAMQGRAPAMRERAEAIRARMKAVADAFEGDAFDAKALGVGQSSGEMARAWADGMVEFVEAMLPVLTPEQRSKLAERLRQVGASA